jgi:hypothetical protein
MAYLSNRGFQTYTAILNACQQAWLTCPHQRVLAAPINPANQSVGCSNCRR